MIFPYIFMRYAGADHQSFRCLRIPGLDARMAAIDSARAALADLSEKVCNALYQAIPACSSKQDQQLLLNIKRDVHNLRPVKNGQLEKAQRILITDVRVEEQDWRPLLLEYNEMLKQAALGEEEWRDYFAAQLLQHRQLFQEMCKEDVLQKGLLLSSAILFGQLHAYCETAVADFRHRELRNEFSLLRYMTRLCFKTSPFSTFTYLGLASLGEVPGGHQPMQGQPVVSSHVRLNNLLLQHLQHLLSRHPQINDCLHVRLNPSVFVTEKHIRFLVNFNNIESFQQLPKSDLVQVIMEALAVPVRMRQLTETLLEEFVDGDAAPLKQYLLQLVEAGLLEFDFHTSGTDPHWHLRLACYLDAIKQYHPLLEDVCGILRLLDENAKAYKTAGAAERSGLLTQMHDGLHDFFNAFLADIGIRPDEERQYRDEYAQVFAQQKSFSIRPFLLRQFRKEKILYEDTATSSQAVIDERSLRQLAGDMDKLCGLLQPLSPHGEIQQMQEFFTDRYGRQEHVSLLTFYHDYYAMGKKDRLPVSQVPMTAFRNALQHNIAASGYALHFNYNDLAHLAAPCNPLPRGMFIQLYEQEGQLSGVVNGMFSGMGRASGRFMHLFPDEVTTLMQERNAAMHKDCMLMELTDSSFFNANIHPPLLPYELSMPGGHNNLPPDRRIAVKDIRVAFDGQLYLLHAPSGRRILPYDMCLQSILNRSQLYQLLACFSPFRGTGLQTLCNVIHDAFAKDADVMSLPRIVYENRLVLRRHAWHVRTGKIPDSASFATAADFCRALYQWRKAHHIPAHVFLYLQPKRREAKPGDDYKPQYIHFDSPLLLSLWGRLMTKAGEHIYLEEVLPDMELASGLPVNECLVQWH